MTEREVRDSSRKLKRDMYKTGMRKNYLKALTEPITNSDDSYRRIEEKIDRAVDSKREIMVYVNQERKEFQIVDFAEGLSRTDMDELFPEYGEEKKSHFEKGRGLFGQGLLDLSYSRERGSYVHSIKDDEYCYAQFKWKTKSKNQKPVERRIMNLPDNPLRVTRKIRERLHIPSGNGTCVVFQFLEAEFPNEGEIITNLSNFYMLRFINSSAKREVRVIFLKKDGGVKSEHQLKYTFPNGKLIKRSKKRMIYKPFSPIQIEAEIYESDDPLSQAEAGSRREGGLLVFDEHDNVLDLTLFGYDNDPYAAKLFGRVKLVGAYKVIREKLNENEEILSQTRDGLVKSHYFYQKLKKIMDKLLKPIVDQEKNKEGTSKSNLSDYTVRRHKEALRKLNELYEKLNKRIENLGTDPGVGLRPPENGIEFDRKTTVIAEGKNYHVRLRVDTRKISIGSCIDIISDNNTISATPPQVTVENPRSRESILSHMVLLHGYEKDQIGMVRAEVNGVSTYIQVSVVEEVLFFPSSGLEFNPDSYHSEPARRRKIYLYADIEKIPLGSTIGLSSTNEKIKIESREIVVREELLQSNGAAKIEIPYRGSGIGQRGRILAKQRNYSAEASIQITSGKKKRTSGIFTDWDYRPLNTTFQAWHDAESGKIIINSNHPINRTFFGESAEEAQESIELYPHCQILLAELVVSECLALAVHTAYINNELDIRYKGDPYTDVRRYIQDNKKEIGKEIFDLFVDKSAVMKMKTE